MFCAADIVLRKLGPETPDEAVIALYTDAQWWEEGYTSGFIAPMIAGSFAVIGAYDGDRLVGMGRAIADKASDAYIQDIVVLSEYRKRGIGAAIVRELIARLKAAGVDWIGLIAAPGATHFYEELGFEVLKDHTPMRLK